MPNPPNDIYDVVDAIKVRPAMYLGESSLTALHQYLNGYRAALIEFEIELSKESPPFHHFHDWVRMQYGESWPSPLGWCSTIVQESPDEKTALDTFFRLLERFRMRRPRTVASVRLRAEHKLTGYRTTHTGGWEPLPPPVAIQIVQFDPDHDVYSRSTYDVCVKGTADPIGNQERHHANLADAILEFEKSFNILPHEWNRQDNT